MKWDLNQCVDINFNSLTRVKIQLRYAVAQLISIFSRSYSTSIWTYMVFMGYTFALGGTTLRLILTLIQVNVQSAFRVVLKTCDRLLSVCV